jgi:hypothetical protein
MKSLGSGPQIVVAVVEEASGRVPKMLRGPCRFEAAPPGLGALRRIAFNASVDVTGERNMPSQIACGVSDRRALRTSACLRLSM